MEQKIQKKAYDIVKNSNNNWLNVDNIKDNLEEKGFIIEEKEMNEASCLFYTKDKNIKILSLNESLNQRTKAKELLYQYSYYEVSNISGKGFIMNYHSDIKGQIKKQTKYMSQCLVDLSVEKEFDTENFNEEKIILRR